MVPIADTKISALAALLGVNLASGDLFPLVDVSDTSMAASGTDKSITAAELAAAMKTLGPMGLAIFGDGSDGAVTLSAGTTTLTRDMYYDTLTVPSGAVLVPSGYRIYCKTLCQVDLGGVIRNNGGDGAATTTAGTQTGRGTLDRSGAGGNGGTAAGVAGSAPNQATSLGGTGGTGGSGASGAGAAGGTVTAPTANQGSPRGFPLLGVYYGQAGAINIISGGSGGGGGGGDGTAGGGGGGGGGALLLAARTLVLNGTIEAKGGNGGSPAAGNRGGGGGGGGGTMVVVYNSKSGSGSLSVAGGTGGTKTGTGTNGANGGDGVLMEVPNA